MSLENFITLQRFTASRWGRFVLPALGSLAVWHALAWVFLLVENEREMGAVQRVFYFHVASAFVTYTLVGVMLVSALGYLSTKKWQWDLVGYAAASVGFLFCTIVLLSGMIWGHSAWNTWWRWEPRLVSFLVLWLVFFSLIFLRRVTEGEGQQANLSAVLSILAAVNVPIVIFSIKLLSHAEQLHPEVIGRQGLRDVSFYYGLLASVVALHLLAVWLWWVKLTELLLCREVDRRIAERED